MASPFARIVAALNDLFVHKTGAMLHLDGRGFAAPADDCKDFIFRV